MAKLIYRYTDEEYCSENREISDVEFSIPDDLNINEFKVICVRLASSMGYAPTSIKKTFGKLK